DGCNRAKSSWERAFNTWLRIRDWGMALSHTGKSTYLLLSAASEALAADVGSIGFKCADDKILQDWLPFRVGLSPELIEAQVLEVHIRSFCWWW
ncbi:hypothetical protein, partial [Mesorhizobium sp. M0276]|uniref:hypothetical protein n=1 Tax=Mesorhizobium sp. M0276 TaxID=2956928 RepID=UPI003334C39F